MIVTPMRIGLITGEYPPMQGGVGAFTSILAGEMAVQGHEVFILSRAGTQSTDPRVHLDAAVTNWNLGSLRTARQWAHDNRLDVVNIQYQTAAFSMSPSIHFLPEALRPIPVVTTFHDLRFPYLFPKAAGLRDWIVMRLARASKGIIATNHEDMQCLSGLPSALIPIGSNIMAPPGDPKIWREKAGAADDDFLIVYFGLINQSKGLDTLLESVGKLRDLPVRLALIGGGAGSSDPTNVATMQALDRQIERLKLEPILYRTGYLEDAAISGYLAAADAVALPFNDGASYRRGTLMAALHMGCAIVTSQPEVPIPAFVGQENMLLVPPREAGLLADALRHLYESPTTRAKLRQGAVELSQRFAWPEIAQSTLQFYRRTLGATV